MKNKYERSQRRKEQKRIEKEYLEKNKEKVPSKIKPKWRKLNDGGVAFGDKFKIGRTGLYVMPTLVGLVIFVSIGLTGVYDEFLESSFGSNNVNTDFEFLSFGECQDIQNNHDSCALQYKFCMEYADGTTTCEYAEHNPFFDVDPEERKFTEEEQDFLPPTVPWQGLSCDEMIDFSATEEHNLMVIEMHLEFHTHYMNNCSDTEMDMGGIIPQAFGASLQQEKIWIANVAKCGAYECGDTDDDEVIEESPFDGKTIRLTKTQYDTIDPISLGIERSKSCVASSTCISNRELVALYDNTHQVYSGEFIEDGNGDVVRAPSDYQKHWNIYPYVGMPVVIAVEPDVKWVPYMSANIIIEPSTFIYINPEQNIYMNHIGGNVTHYNDIYINGCDWGRVAADPALINELVEYFLSECETDTPQRETMVMIPIMPINHDDFKWYKYSEWMQSMKQECKELC